MLEAAIEIGKDLIRVQAELGIRRPVEELVATSLQPVDWAASWSWLHGAFMPTGSGAGGHFPGWTALALAVLGVLLAIRHRHAWPLVYGALALGFAVLSLGPELRVGDAAWPLPYGLLHAGVPGFSALRNPYRAAFVAAVLVAPLVGLGAAGLVDALRCRWRRAVPAGLPIAGVPVAGLLALALAGLHLLEAWPGPQQVAALPDAPSPAHVWLERHGGEGAALELPLPDPPDLNARYQLGTVGLWTPLVNGHSGLYPPELLELYDVDAAFPAGELLGAVKERYPVEWIIVHHDRMTDGTVRERAAAAPELDPVWNRRGTVIYRLDPGAPAGWLRRRHRRGALTGTMLLEVPRPGICRPRLTLDGEAVDVVAVDREPAGFRLSLELPRELPELVEVEVWLTAPGPGPPVALAAEAGPASGPAAGGAATDRRGAVPGPEPGGLGRVRVNGWPVARGPVALARVDGRDGRLEAATGSRSDRAADALRDLLEDADAGDWIGVAAVEGPAADPLLVERLRLLSDAAGGAVPAGPLEEAARAWTLVGRVGSPAGSAAEDAGLRSAGARAPTPVPACLTGPVSGVRFVR